MTTIVRGRYYPAIVQLPAEPQPRRKAYVLLAEGGEHGGLHVFQRASDVADVHLPIDWTRTVVPPGRGARNGFTVRLVGGAAAVITAGSGCRCGALGRWAGPGWANTVAVRA